MEATQDTENMAETDPCKDANKTPQRVEACSHDDTGSCDGAPDPTAETQTPEEWIPGMCFCCSLYRVLSFFISIWVVL